MCEVSSFFRSGRSALPALLLWATLAAGGCASSSHGSSGSDPYGETEVRRYRAGYRTTINTVAQALSDIGLNVDGGTPKKGGTYVVSAKDKQRVSGRREAIQVASIKVFIHRVKNNMSEVRVETEKVSRTSMAGQSSAHRQDYARKLYDRLGETLTPAAPQAGSS